MLHRRTLIAMGLFTVLVAGTLPLEACGVRGLRSTARAGRSYYSASTRADREEERWAKSLQPMTSKEGWDEIKKDWQTWLKICQRYKVSADTEKDLACVERVIDKWHNDADHMMRPSREDLLNACGGALGHGLTVQGPIEWVQDEDAFFLAGKNRKVFIGAYQLCEMALDKKLPGGLTTTCNNILAAANSTPKKFEYFPAE
jgi:hypothetical protein